MPSIDTVLTHVTDDTTLTAVTVASGDSLQVRAFAPPTRAYLDDIIIKGAATVEARLTSPYLADTTRGITIQTAQAPSIQALPRFAPQSLATQDTLDLSATSGASDSSIVALQNYYTDLGASNARLHSWGDIAGNIAQIKPVEVDATSSATIGNWAGLVITTDEDLLRANTDYAVLGYILNVACAVVGIQGQDTGNFRICGPGITDTYRSSSYFVDKANDTGRPYIPVINAANAGNTNVVLADNAASTAVKVQLVLAQPATNLPN